MSRYFRLMGLALADIIFTAPPAIFAIWLNAHVNTVGPWRSWADTHLDYGRVEQYPAVLWRSNRLAIISLSFTQWVTPACALIFFAFFGFADEAKRNYRAVFWMLVKPLGLRPSSSRGGKLSIPSIG